MSMYAGKGQLVSYEGPGIFLQGLAVYSRTGSLLPGAALPGSELLPVCCFYMAFVIWCVIHLD